MTRKSDAPPGKAGSLPLVGAQLSTAGGWSTVPERAVATEAEVVQVFSSNPRMWPTAPPDAQALDTLRCSLETIRRPLFMHAIYLINPASPDPALRDRSAEALAHALLTGALAGAAGVVTHLGSHRGEGFDKATDWITDTLLRALMTARTDASSYDRGPDDLPVLLLETAAGAGATVGGTLAELQTLVGLLTPQADEGGRPSIGVCLDTAHMFASGYAVHQPPGLAALVEELRERDLLRRVGLVHLNDSLSLLGSKRDRHANPGEGELGYSGLAALVRHPAFATVPFVLEVPGSEGHGPGAAEIKTVKRMRRATPSPPEPLGDS